MKRGVVAAVSAALILLLVAASVAAADAPIRVKVNGQYLVMDTDPVNVNGRVMVPARFVAEALGADVSWDQQDQTVVVENKVDKLATLTNAEIDDAQMSYNNYLSQVAAMVALPPAYKAYMPARSVPGGNNAALLLTPWAAVATDDVASASGDYGAIRSRFEYRLFFYPSMVRVRSQDPPTVLLKQGEKLVAPVLATPEVSGTTSGGEYVFWTVGLSTSQPVEFLVTTSEESASFTYDLSQLK